MTTLRRRIVDPLLVVLLVSTVLTPALAERRPREGFLEIVSSTTGAEVFIDGERIGEVPIEAPVPLPPGEHSVKVSKRGFTQHLEVVAIKMRKTTVLEADLLALSGVLRVESDVDGARVFIDDDYVGDTPIDREVEPGSRVLKLELLGYHDYERTVEVVAGEETEVEVELERLPPEEDPTIVEPAGPRPLHEQWWFWTAIGVVVVGVAVAVPLAVLGSNGDYCNQRAGWGSCDDAILVDFRSPE